MNGSSETPATFNRSARRGTTVVEMTVCFALLVVLVALVGQMFTLSSRQAEATARQAAGLQLLENALEEFTTRPWDEMTTDAIAQIAVPENARRRWPDAQLAGEVVQVDAPVAAKRITLMLEPAERSRQRPVTLTTWVYRMAEEGK
jgi:Tfp pilus assembly protein PilE